MKLLTFLKRMFCRHEPKIAFDEKFHQVKRCAKCNNPRIGAHNYCDYHLRIWIEDEEVRLKNKWIEEYKKISQIIFMKTLITILRWFKKRECQHEWKEIWSKDISPFLKIKINWDGIYRTPETLQGYECTKCGKYRSFRV